MLDLLRGTVFEEDFLAAEALEPDFGKFGSRPYPTDTKCKRAPDRIGKLLARKKVLLAEAEALERSVELRSELEIRASNLHNMAKIMFDHWLRSKDSHKSMVLRNNGWMVKPSAGAEQLAAHAA